ncbi:MAG TPA: hypothetical protein PKM65_09875 [Spirochaetota bacterium]|nr:hypothetical protein [Spirochaetota bacterium]HNT12395.1 hypothetical protein [Spirochaetota bacterium]HNV47064.1 hypothetical protein [Spirochaetota bacterium]HOS38599.1 hypothetical protein [Spirochaetota bacterium]HPU87295.1 hypothetical protein [Spirochaetota bacterium]
MRIETTININIETLKRIEAACHTLRISRSRLIAMLIECAMRERRDTSRMCRRVRYQERLDPAQWRKLHITLDAALYECMIDLRKIDKVSVSFILALSVQKHITALLLKGMNTNKTDNYPIINYIFSKTIVGGVISWRVFWGIPTNLPTLACEFT